MNKPRHILVLRLSALGDVAMTIPVVRLLLEQNPELQISFVSDPFMQPLFEGIERLQFYGANTKKDYKGLIGLWKLSRLIKRDIHFDAIADLHNVLRSKILCAFLSNGNIAVLDKGREEKRELTRTKNKILRPLKTGFQRYADVFEQLGLFINLQVGTGIPNKKLINGLDKSGKKWIGIAPFAKHAAKMYPLNKMKEFVKLLSNHQAIKIILFGSYAEASTLKDWESLSDNIESMAGRSSFSDELELISHLDLMISMDSANMHLASVYGVPVVSIWGGTHPWLGFYGWRQAYESAIQLDLPCRPSSVFGNKECPVHGRDGCMEGISSRMIYDSVMKMLDA